MVYIHYVQLLIACVKILNTFNIGFLYHKLMAGNVNAEEQLLMNLVTRILKEKNVSKSKSKITEELVRQ